MLIKQLYNKYVQIKKKLYNEYANCRLIKIGLEYKKIILSF